MYDTSRIEEINSGLSRASHQEDGYHFSLESLHHMAVVWSVDTPQKKIQEYWNMLKGSSDENGDESSD